MVLASVHLRKKSMTHPKDYTHVQEVSGGPCKHLRAETAVAPLQALGNSGRYGVT